VAHCDFYLSVPGINTLTHSCHVTVTDNSRHPPHFHFSFSLSPVSMRSSWTS